MPSLPPGMKNGTLINSLPNGKLELLLVSEGKQTGGIQMDPSKAGTIAVQLLMAAKTAHDRTGKPLPSGLDKTSEWPILQPSTIALGPCQITGHESLIVRSGEALIGFAIQHSALRALGEALIALSAQGKAQ